MSVFIVIFHNRKGDFKDFMYNNTIRALEIIFKGEYDLKNPAAALRGIAAKNQLITAERNDTIINQEDPVKYFYLLLKGRACVLNHITWNNDNVVDFLEPLDILGMVEYLNNVDAYTAFVMAATDCVLFRIPVEIFIHIIQENAFLCYQTLLVLGKVLESNMNRAETNSLFHPKDILGHYLYLQAEHVLPYVCQMTRQVLAEKLHINLRTLYRHIDSMKENGYLTLRKGKIVIEAEHFERLKVRYGDIVL